MIIEIDITDEISPAVQRALEHNDAYLRHVAKSVGWYFQKETKKRIREGAPNNEQYDERLPYNVRKKLSPHAPRMWYGRLANAIGYEYAGNGKVLIGWTSPTATFYGHLQEYGYQRQVTSAVRRFFASVGVPLGPSKRVLDIPERPVFRPMTDEMRPKVAPYVEKKVSSYIDENVTFGKKNRRKYKVYGR